MGDRHLIILTKPATPGRVKTRLAEDTGAALACAVQRQLLGHCARPLALDPRWQTHVSVRPRRARLNTGRAARQQQSLGDLGARIAAPFHAMPAADLLLVGSDIPGITRSRIAAAFQALRAGRPILGPCPDGGFWLVGLPAGVMRAGPHGLRQRLRRVPWSAADTTRRAIEALVWRGHHPILIEPLRDVDTLGDYIAWQAQLRRTPVARAARRKPERRPLSRQHPIDAIQQSPAAAIRQANWPTPRKETFSCHPSSPFFHFRACSARSCAPQA